MSLGAGAMTGPQGLFPHGNANQERGRQLHDAQIEAVARALYQARRDAEELPSQWPEWGQQMNQDYWRAQALVAVAAIAAYESARGDVSVDEALELLDSLHGDNRMAYGAYSELHDAISRIGASPDPTVKPDREREVAEAAWNAAHKDFCAPFPRPCPVGHVNPYRAAIENGANDAR